MAEKRNVFHWQIYFGIMLILMGALFVADLFLETPIMDQYWPLLVVLFGLTFIVEMLTSKSMALAWLSPGRLLYSLVCCSSFKTLMIYGSPGPIPGRS